MLCTRIANLHNLLKISSFLIGHKPNIFYLTGKEDLEAKILISPNKNYLFVDNRYLGRCRGLEKYYEIVCVKTEFLKTLRVVFKKNKIKKVGYEAKHLSDFLLTKFRKRLSLVAWLPTIDLIESLREVKDPHEIELIKKACAISDKGFEFIFGKIKEGITEKKLAWELEKFFRNNGADDRAFKIIVASGKQSAIPHHLTSTKKIKKGEIILIDAGVYFKGYCSDCTRVFALSPVSTKVREIYEIVHQAQETALNTAKAGKKARMVDLAARKIIKKFGYGNCFGHGTGHGVGIRIHELPTVSFLNKKTVLRENSVITIEPGIYLENTAGVRIEDTILVKKKSVDKLTKVSSKIRIL